jgi:hypothetical protein
LTLDLLRGAPISSNVSILDGSETVSGFYVQFTLNNVTDPNEFPGFTFAIDAPSLVGYAGGALASISDPFVSPSTLFLNSLNPSDNANLQSGSLTAIPEPSTWALMLLGFAALGYAGFCRPRSAMSAKRRASTTNG